MAKLSSQFAVPPTILKSWIWSLVSGASSSLPSSSKEVETSKSLLPYLVPPSPGRLLGCDEKFSVAAAMPLALAPDAASRDVELLICDLTMACRPGAALPVAVDHTAMTALDLASSCPSACTSAAACCGGGGGGGLAAPVAASGWQPSDLSAWWTPTLNEDRRRSIATRLSSRPSARLSAASLLVSACLMISFCLPRTPSTSVCLASFCVGADRREESLLMKEEGASMNLIQIS